MFDLVLRKGAAFCLSFFYCLGVCEANEAAFVELGVGLQDIHYSETSSASFLLNREKGAIPVVSVTGWLNRGRASLFMKANFAHASIDYRGYTQSFQSLETSTDTTRINGSLGALYQLEEQFSLFMMVAGNYWAREIQGTMSSLPLDEYYRWKSIVLGTDLTLFEDESQQLNFRFSVGKLFDEELEIDLSSLGYGTPVLPLKGERVHRFEVGYLRNLSSDLDLSLDLGYFSLEFDQSDEIAVSNALSTITLREPQSETTGVSLTFGFRFKF